MRRDIFLLISVLFFSVLFRLIILTNSSLTFFSDDAVYAALAQYWRDWNLEKAFHPTWPPLYPFLGAITFNLYPSWEIAMRIVSMVSAVLLFSVIFFFVKNILSLKHAVIFTTMFSLFYPIVYASLFPFSDMLSTALIISSLVFLFFFLRFENRNFLLMGSFSLGLTYLTRSEGTLFFFLSLVYLFFIQLKRSFRERKIAFSHLMAIPLFIGVFFITASPYLIATKYQLGGWTLSAKFSAQIQREHAFELRDGTTWSQEAVSVKSPQYNSKYFTGGTEYLLEHSESLFLSFLGKKMQDWFNLFIKFFPWWSIIIALLGVIAGFRSFFSGHFFLFYILATAVPITIFSTATTDVRYLLWVFPLFFYFFYRGILFSVQALTRNLSFSLVLNVTPVIVSSFLPLIVWSDVLNPFQYAQNFTRRHYRPQLVEVAHFIRRHSAIPEPRIMTRYEMVEFYSGGMTIYMPEVNFDKLLEYARSQNVDYLVAWNGELNLDPNLSFLVDDKLPHPGLKKVYSTGTPEGPLFIYVLDN